MATAPKKKEEKLVEAKHFGTHKEMVVKKLDTSVIINDQKYDVIAKDDNGMYFTNQIWVANGLMDPFRNARRTEVSSDMLENFA